jgi:protein SCO1
VNNTKYWQLIYLIPILASLALGIAWGMQRFSYAKNLTAAQLLPTPVVVSQFALENALGESVDAKLFSGKWTLVFFGFTSCPDICPLELQKLSKVLQLVGEKSALQVVFVSVDPERDTKEKMADYVSFFHTQIMGVRGSNTQLAGLAQFFGAAYDRSIILDGKLLSVPAGIDMPVTTSNDASENNYQVNHSTRFFIVNPKGEFVGSFAPPHEVETIRTDIQILMNGP